MEITLEAGADDINLSGEFFEVTCEVAALEAVKAALQAKNIPWVTAEVTKIPNSSVQVAGNDAKQLLALMEALEEHEDVQAVHGNFDISDEEMEKAAQ